jgi:hypothetical protein
VGSLKNRLRALEARHHEQQRPPAPGTAQEEIRVIDAEIRKLQREMRAAGIDPDQCLRDVDVGLPLDEHIAMLEAEIAQEEEIERCPEA